MIKDNQWLGQVYDSKNIKNCIIKIKEEFGQQFSEAKSIREQHTHTMTIQHAAIRQTNKQHAVIMK